MDWSAFGLSRRPFRPFPDPSGYVPTAGHDAALADLRTAYEAGEDGAVLSGESGSGKTLLLHHFLDWLPADTPKMLLPTAKYGKPVDLHQAIVFDLDQPWQGLSESELRLTVTAHLMAELTRDRTTVIAIDEAQHLSVETIEELRLLGNIATAERRATFVVLVGMPSLIDRLNSPWLSATAERFRAKPVIPALTADETQTYLWGQLEAAGSRDPERLLTTESAQLIAEWTGGIPRRINHLAGTALALAAAGESDTLDCEAILEAAERLGYHQPADTLELIQPLRPESSDESDHTTLTIPPVARDPAPARPPKQRQARRQSA